MIGHAAYNMKSHRVIHLLFGLPNNGQENLVVEMANSQCQQGFTAVAVLNDVIDRRVVDRLGRNVVTIFQRRKIRSRNPFVVVSFLLKLLLATPTIIHCHDPGLLSLFPKFILRRFVVLTIHNTGLYRERINECRAVCFISHAVQRDNVKAGLNISKSQQFVVLNGTSSGRFEVKRNYDLGRDFRILQIGRLQTEQKGQDITLRALKILRQKRDQRFLCHFFGEGYDLSVLEAMAKELGVADLVTFAGNVPQEELATCMAGYHLLVQPSRYEGFGMTLIEAMSAGVPVLAADLEGPKEIIGDSEFGWLHQPDSVEDFVSGVGRVLYSYQANNVEAVCRKALAHVSRQYNVATMIKNYQAVYESVGGCRG